MPPLPDPSPPPSARSQRPASWAREPEGDTSIEENWLFRLRRERYRSRSSGESHDYYVIHLADAVNVIALTPDRRILLVEQFRAGSAQDSLETPGGLLDPGEDPMEAGARELLEETGYAGNEPVLIGTVWSCPSLLTSRITTIMITDVRRVAEPECDAGEELRVELVPVREIPRLIRGGRIGHALAVQGLLWWLVSELPDTPFERPEVFRPGSRQFRIGSIMAAVAAVGVILGVLRSIVTTASIGAFFLLFVMMLVPAFVVVDRVLDPIPRSILTRSNPRIGRRGLMRLLATVGLSLILWLAGLLILIVATRG
ncbi:NUDIX hydrolase [Tautonia plasticadhaerens]|uniref:GDP-mannose pyrophosphatase n=1 Tax=Tautonia plasticadhaerens TaxID=2527974 RepID=A0A518GXE4_9BACT|nr:NUDIX hydrolase [Tautonia plasticadhaerens]QDV33255.1 ADP-ribose pyrophosphatase [Tautonia plasticadhaerens]